MQRFVVMFRCFLTWFDGFINVIANNIERRWMFTMTRATLLDAGSISLQTVDAESEMLVSDIESHSTGNEGSTESSSDEVLV